MLASVGCALYCFVGYDCVGGFAGYCFDVFWLGACFRFGFLILGLDGYLVVWRVGWLGWGGLLGFGVLLITLFLLVGCYICVWVISFCSDGLYCYFVDTVKLHL